MLVQRRREIDKWEIDKWKYFRSFEYCVNNSSSKRIKNKRKQLTKVKGVPQKAIVRVGRPRPYSIIILNMRFIPEASLRASSQTTAISYILERHLWINNSKPFALAPTWSLGCKQTDCITAGMSSKLVDPKLVLRPSEHETLVLLYTMLDQRRRRWADVV